MLWDILTDLETSTEDDRRHPSTTANKSHGGHVHDQLNTRTSKSVTKQQTHARRQRDAGQNAGNILLGAGIGETASQSSIH